jgi:uncharacterized protein YjbI with pentapeptide repeats
MLHTSGCRKEERRMDQEQEPRERSFIRELVPDWRPTREQVLGVVRIAIVLVVLLGVLTLIGLPFGITLWAWVKLLIVPAVIAAGGLWFNRQQRERELQIADRRAQDEALQAYLDQMSDVLIPNEGRPSLYDKDPPDSLRSVARARTLTVLPRLDGDRKARVVQFLYEVDLITRGRLVIQLAGADLRRAILADAKLRKIHLASLNLSEADLRNADLREAVLTGIDLTGAILVGANVSTPIFELRSQAFLQAEFGSDVQGVETTILLGSNLSYVDLSAANLSYADLTAVNLTGADLWKADLRNTNLRNTNLSEADLSRANLSGAEGWTREQLSAAKSLEGATMPDGQILSSALDPRLSLLTFADWLKSKGRGEDGENSGPS